MSRPRPCLDRHPEPRSAACETCWLFEYSQRYRKHWLGDGDAKLNPPPRPSGAPQPFSTMPRNQRIRIRQCMARDCWDWAVLMDSGETLRSGSESSAEEADDEARLNLVDLELAGAFGIRWAVGVTTVGNASDRWADVGFATMQRRQRRLGRTLQSLRHAGFERPHLFVDGARDGFNEYGLNVTYRYPAVLTWGNWFLSLGELVVREPFAQFYAIFQDDLVCSANLRTYLEANPLPADPRGYMNLYCAPKNETTNGNGKPGWREAPIIAVTSDGLQLQGGQGAVALVFSRESALAILASPHANRKSQDPRPEFRHKKADGGVVTAMNYAGWREYVHHPSLVQHVGAESSMGNGYQPPSTTFKGESFDLMELLR